MYGTDTTRNALHGSDSAKSAEREIEFFFPHLNYERVADSAYAKITEHDEAERSTLAAAGRSPEDKMTADDLEDLDLDALSIDEIAAKVFSIAKESGEDIDTVVDRINAGISRRAPHPVEVLVANEPEEKEKGEL